MLVGSMGFEACATSGVVPGCQLLRAAAGESELNQGVAALVCGYTSVTIDLDPLQVMGAAKLAPFADVP